MDFLNQNYLEIKRTLCGNSLPKYDYLFDLTDKVSAILECEKTSYRPLDQKGSAGALVDFQKDRLPLVVVPDLHARPEFLMNLLNYKLHGRTTVYDSLRQKKIRLVFVGDIMHTERNTKERWIAAKTEFDNEIFTGPSMSQEMQAGLSLLCGLLKLKQCFPEYVHILKGNHENIFNATGNGDFSFRKYADEGHMVRCFVQEYYGDDIVYMIHCVERALPLVFVGKKCVISHAEPKSSYSKEQIINARNVDGVVEGLTWTDIGEAEEGSVQNIIRNLVRAKNISDYVYIGGHRPVSSFYDIRQNGLYIQIHNPAHQQIAYVDAKNKFNPEKSIIEVNR